MYIMYIMYIMYVIYIMYIIFYFLNHSHQKLLIYFILA